MDDLMRLKKNTDFRKVYGKGSSQANRYLVIFVLPNRQAYNRVGFSASKKVGKSVIRNRVRRLMKESFRKLADKIEKGYDIVFIARVNVKDASYSEVEKAMLHLLKKSKLLSIGDKV
ncbi:MAG: ribonuclease P protein component [Thermotaleaceae bacterium]